MVGEPARIEGLLGPALACLAPRRPNDIESFGRDESAVAAPLLRYGQLRVRHVGRLVIALDAATGKEENLTGANGANTKENRSES